MIEPINKPIVFLSHSSGDGEFVHRIHDDLVKCQIAPWIYTKEIRDGMPWLKIIFQNGLPACDVFLVYLTENSISSQMVEKEIDAALVTQLGDSTVRFLPYVDNAATRSQLRVDIRALQCREWNEENYNEVLPQVVAEIWHSYLERVVSTATLQEKTKRLELEKALAKIEQERAGSIFQPSEESDFQYIKDTLNRHLEVTCKVMSSLPSTENEDRFRIIYLDAIVFFLRQKPSKFAEDTFLHSINNFLAKYDLPGAGRAYTKIHVDAEVVFDLTTLGLIAVSDHQISGQPLNRYYDITDKMRRFVYWLKYTGYSLELPAVEKVGVVEE